MIGKKISHYKILEKLDEGGMGIVFKAKDLKLNRIVALKFLPPALTKNPTVRKRFIQEARAASALDHPNICVIHEIDEIQDEQMFICMAYYDGDTLEKKIAGGQMSIDSVIDIAIQIIQGIIKAHEHGIIHRDIKPGNIMITNDGKVKILDFGLAKLAGQIKITQNTATVGTVAYMSPEQARSNDVDHQSDIWSCGVVLYEMVTGQLPFRGDYHQVVLYSILNDEPEPLSCFRPDTSAELQRIVNQALVKSKTDRYQSAAQMIDDLEALKKDLKAGNLRERNRVSLPFPLEGEPEVYVSEPICVGRERELSRMDKFLAKMLNNKAQVVFVTGEAGSGKTTLMHEFIRRAQELHTDLIVASGKCHANTGIGDPYLPFREILSLLTSDVEALRTAGAMKRDHAIRLWNLLPFSVKALLNNSPDLIDTFISGEGLVRRSTHFTHYRAEWLTELKKFVKSRTAAATVSNLQQSDLFKQVASFLKTLSRGQPLLLFLDDLQWADAGSISLLFHLGRKIEGNRILIVGAFRPTEVAMGRNGERHPLESVVNEFRGIFGSLEIEVDRAAGRQFVNAFIDTEPNQLSTSFRDTLFQQTEGHALFTVELLRSMQDIGALVQDAEGRWIEGSELNWNTLPARVDAVLGERIGRLPENLKKVLTIASIEGEEFTAEVVARLHGINEREMIQLLSAELDKRHHLLNALGIQRKNGQRLSQYRFRHVLFQKYLYNSLDDIERAYLHEETGNVLENLYGEQVEEIAVRLARHFHEAGIYKKAIDYLIQAGNRALKLSANDEAIKHFTNGLSLLATLPESQDRSRQELTLQIALAVPLIATKGWATPEVEQTYLRARELSQLVGETSQLFTTLRGLWGLYATSGKIKKSHELGKQLVAVAERAQDSALAVAAHRSLGASLLYLGEFSEARNHLEQGIALYDSQQHNLLAFRYGHDPGVICKSFASLSLWMLGYPDQALKMSDEALGLAKELSHPFSLVYALIFAAMLHQACRKVETNKQLVESAVSLSIEHNFEIWKAMGMSLRGGYLVEQGKIMEGITQLQEGLSAYMNVGANTYRPYFLAIIADSFRKIGKPEEGLSALSEALAYIQESGERQHEAELYRLKGELSLMKLSDEAEIEKCFYQSLDIARRQNAKSWELRTVMSLSRFRQKQGKRKEAQMMLESICSWFSEGYETADLKEAKALLEELS
ncbi:hypothetical protein EH223_13445 [candidate division KSB1 bacterium]|nr:protein kinase [candidate division KSB1 bacterium]RQW02053.1 MAG: hypothetical protein EH223_13445 [candidate division KSB1 bacterium]